MEVTEEQMGYIALAVMGGLNLAWSLDRVADAQASDGPMHKSTVSAALEKASAVLDAVYDARED